MCSFGATGCLTAHLSLSASFQLWGLTGRTEVWPSGQCCPACKEGEVQFLEMTRTVCYFLDAVCLPTSEGWMCPPISELAVRR